MCIAEEVVEETKIERLQRMSELRETVAEAKAIQEEIDSEPMLISKIYAYGFMFFGAIGSAIAIFAVLSAFWESIKFNYYLYVANGTFRFLKTEDDAEERIRKRVAKQVKGLDPKQVDSYGWFTTLGMNGVATLFIFALVKVLSPLNFSAKTELSYQV